MRFYTTCPPSSAYDSETYALRVAQVAQWSESAGAEGALIYTDNSLADPWTVAQLMLSETKNFIPMIAAQPSLHAAIYRRKTYLFTRHADWTQDCPQYGCRWFSA